MAVMPTPQVEREAETPETPVRSQAESRGSTVTEQSPFERLLVPIDFSSASREAFTVAMRMAEVWKSKVILFYAPGSDGNDEFLDHTGVPWGRDDVVAEAHGQLSRFAETVVPGSRDRICIDSMRADDAVRAVEAACERHSPSLVVLGTHPRDRRRWTRSRAERIARAVPCPVMMVRGAPEAVADAD
jgi:nucleotide-binding universal stress UspA family protein